MRRLSFALVLTLAAASLGAGTTAPRLEPLPMGGKLWIKQVDGRVEVEGWDRPEVELVAEGEDAAELARLRVERTREGLLIAVPRHHVFPFGFILGGRGRRHTVHLRLKVPRRLNVDIRSVDGPIRVHQLEGYAGVTTVDGPIELEAIAGEIHARAVDGRIRGRDLRARVKASTVDGSITLERVAGGLDLHTVDGTVRAEDLDGWGEGLQVRTVDGKVHLRLGAAKGLVDARSQGGTIRASAPGLTATEATQHRFTGTVPGRDQAIRIRTIDGSIDIQ
ncbi:DUF4097 family beta strand repeat-containing protein [Mesoterricola sediminis]|uniref:DUF4097 domain-containing protein n=1 Tax=Mesoterricola sediminis TaxID=2927980 RepID=A0AA48HC78_9BACT|nr:DUF4097 family beta strand repeat-containing protein [Mesoterricola sediminis]BDU75618.1 hypothetical protein METESE_05760 [Mesoterricola sediminis]